MDIAINLLIVGLAVIWLALVVWTFSDARRRIADRFLVGCATLGALFPFVGPLVYMIVRPPEFLEDVRERELEIAAAEASLASAKAHSCPHCDEPTERDFMRCPSCLRRLREPCTTCSKPLDAEWRICPYCETDRSSVARSEAPSTARRKRTAASQATGETSGAAREQSAATRATTKAAAKRRRAPADGAASDATSSGGAAGSENSASHGSDGSPEPEATV